MKRIILILLIFFSSLSLLLSQTPEIKWWYDINDSSFGNSAIADIDFDGLPEIVFSCYRNDSMVYALNAEDGSLLWKYNTGGCNDAAPIIYDVDNDDTLEIIVASSCTPATFCFNGTNGQVEWFTFLHGSDSPPTIADIDNDGKTEILHGNFGGYVSCLNGEDGSINWDILVDGNSWIQTAAIILDADNDGHLDFIVGNWSFGSNHKIFCYRCDNQSLLWESDLPNDYMYHGAAFADIDNDGYMEIAIGTYDGTLLVLNAENGSLKWDFSFPSPLYMGAAVSMADLNNDNKYEIVVFDNNHLGVLNNTGELQWTFDIPNYGSSFRGASLADINNDDTLDVVFGTSKGQVFALNGSEGNLIWQVDLAAHIDSSNFEIDHAPIIADFDQDGFLDIFIVGGHTEYPDTWNNYGRAYAISTNSQGGPEWTMFRHDITRSAAVAIADTTNFIGNIDKDNLFIEVYPNPAYCDFTIEYKLQSLSEVNIQIINSLGIVENNITNGIQPAGSYCKHFTEGEISNTKLNAGIYFIRFEVKNKLYYKKLIITG